LSIRESSNVTGAKYDESTRDLTVEFKSGAKYAYKDVPMDAVRNFQADASPGAFVAQVLGRYEYRKLPDPDKDKG
jgi:hypothetical protein